MMRKRNGNSGKSFTVSYAAIGVVSAVLAIFGVGYRAMSAIATKEDVESIRTTVAPILDRHETRLRDLEIQMARFFGSAQAGARPPVPSVEHDIVSGPRMVLAQMPGPQQQAPQQIYRRTVVPEELIRMYRLEPTRGGSYSVLGQDGRLYSIDDVLAVVIEMHLAELHRGVMRK